MVEEQELLVETDGDVALLTLNRPARRNALSTSLLVSLARTLEGLEAERATRCVIVRGAGEKAFSAGMDLTAVPDGLPEDVQQRIEEGGPLQFGLEAIERCFCPVIAMIRGYALGAGCELSMACDIRVGSENCQMGMPPARLGIVYPPVGLMRFIRTVGLPTTKKVFYTAKRFPAFEAREMGMLDYVVPDGEFEEFTFSLAREIAANAPLAITGHKRSLYLLTRPGPVSEEDRAEMDSLMMKALGSEDAKEGMAAFVEKREPLFRGE